MKQERLLSVIMALSFFGLASCVPPEIEDKEILFDYTLDDPAARRIVEHELNQDLDSLLYYLKHENPNFRYGAASGFASFQSDQALEQLEESLFDSIIPVAEMAAFAVGQIGKASSVSSLKKAFKSDDREGKWWAFNGLVLEATGKCGGSEELEMLTGISTYKPSDTLLLRGQAGGVFQLMLKGITSEEGNRLMADLISGRSYPSSVKVIASQYFYRCRDSGLRDHLYTLRKQWEESGDARIRMGVATALGRFARAEMIPGLLELFESEEDYRVRVNFFKGLKGRKLETVENFVLEKFVSWEKPLQTEAADYLEKSGSEEGSISYWDLARNEGLEPGIQAMLLGASLRNLPFYYTVTQGSVIRRLRDIIEETNDPYLRRQAYLALAAEPKNLNLLENYTRTYRHAVDRSGLAEAFAKSAEMLDKPPISPGEKRAYQRRIAGNLFEAIKSEDAGAAAVAAQALEENWSAWSGFMEGKLDQVEAVSQKLQLPGHLETVNALRSLLATAGKGSYAPLNAENFLQMDWSVFDRITAESRALISTNKGLINMKFEPEQSPLTVVNFVRLSEEGFFEGKKFHRVVPNFVAQTGCPRGDGFGSLDYCIRSELDGGSYESEGKVGMASAGLHTESCQWFITHSPALHLDGRYTLFGEVDGGMDIVHSLEPGDSIQRIEWKNLKN